MGRSVLVHPESLIRIYFDVSDIEYPEDWDFFEESIKETIINKYKSYVETNDRYYLNSEISYILENDLSYVALSEYCGVACLQVIPKDGELSWDDTIVIIGLAKNFVYRVSQNFVKLFEQWNNVLRKVATFSNGESIYHKVNG